MSTTDKCRTRIGNAPSCDECGEQHSQDLSCEEWAQKKGWGKVSTAAELLQENARTITGELSPISARDALREAHSELMTGFSFERYKVPVDVIDLEHFRKALKILDLLCAAQTGQA